MALLLSMRSLVTINKKIIKNWILSLITNKPEEHLLSSEFSIEDGLDKQSYIQHELSSYQNLAPIHDLNSVFSIEIIHEQHIGEKTILYFLLKNYLNKIVCRTNITIDKKNKITGNNYQTHISPKHIIKNDTIYSIGFSLKSKDKIISIISPQLKIEYFSQGSNFENDDFYIVSFIGAIVEKAFFYFKFKDSIEKREIYFGLPNLSCKPYKIEKNQVIFENNYPLNISYQKDEKILNKENPRLISLPIGEMTITDCLDNDWILTKNIDLTF